MWRDEPCGSTIPTTVILSHKSSLIRYYTTTYNTIYYTNTSDPITQVFSNQVVLHHNLLITLFKFHDIWRCLTLQYYNIKAYNLKASTLEKIVIISNIEQFCFFLNDVSHIVIIPTIWHVCQPGHPDNLIRVLTVGTKKLRTISSEHCEGSDHTVNVRFEALLSRTFHSYGF